MKILIIGSGFTGSTLPLANRLTNMGHEVKFITLYNGVKNPLKVLILKTYLFSIRKPCVVAKIKQIIFLS